jgi:hypothetical protein
MFAVRHLSDAHGTAYLLCVRYAIFGKHSVAISNEFPFLTSYNGNNP